MLIPVIAALSPEHVDSEHSYTSPDERLLIEVVPQKAQQRDIQATFGDFNAWSIDQEEGFLYHPIAIEVDINEEVYVLDYSDHVVKRYTSEGALLHRYGHGPGQGPGETGNPTDFALAPDQKGVFINDEQGRKVEFFAVNDGHVSTIHINHPAWRIAAIHNGRINAAFGSGADHMISVADKQTGDFLQVSPPVIRETHYNVKALVGETAAVQDQIIHVPHYGGLIFSYSLSEGEYTYVTEQVNPPPLPTVERTEINGAVSVGLPYSELNHRNLSVHVDEYSIYILVYRDDQGKSHFYIDTYDLDSGTYRHSYALGQGFRDFAVGDGSLFFVDEERVYHTSYE